MALFKIGRFGKNKDEFSDELSEYNEEEEFGSTEEEPSSDNTGGYSGRFGGRFSDAMDENETDDLDASEDGSFDDDDDGYDADGYDHSYSDADDPYDDDVDCDAYDDDDALYDDDETSYSDDYQDPVEAEADGTYEEDYEDIPATGLRGFLENNDWLTYGALFLFPPLGIFLLLYRKRFQPSFRYAISAVSGIWCILVIALIANGIGNSGDKTSRIVIPTPAATSNIVQQVTIAPDNTASSEDVSTGSNGLGASNGVEPTVAPTATPNVSATVNAQAATNLVWTSAASSYFHKTNTCSVIEPTEVMTQVTYQNARSRGKYACPVCAGTTVYYATAGGTYYHADRTCSSMKNAQVYSLERAQAESKVACPVCVTKTAKELPDGSGKASVVFLTQATTDKSGVRVWFNSSNKNYHLTSSCSGLKDARQGTLKEALLAGKTACKTCCAAAGTVVYCTSGGRYYHSKTNCSGMENASGVTLSEALVLGKESCPTCKPFSLSSVGGSASSGSSASSDPSEYYVYATVNGKYYHIKSNCSGMSGAQRITLKQAITLGKAACPTCCGGANMTVYAASGNKYYHSYATCSGIKNAKSGTLAYALALGLKRCPVCWQSSGKSTTSSKRSSSSSSSTASKGSTGTVTALNATVDNVYVYATRSGTYYHTRSNCSGLSGATRLTLRLAIAAGKKACPTCANGANLTVYSTNGGKYYHKNTSCSGMTSAKKRTLQEAMLLGQTACPVCLASGSAPASSSGSSASSSSSSSKNATTLKKVANFTTGRSGIKVYASTGNPYYHTKKNCSGVSGLVSVPLETALNYGKSACPQCAAASAIRVYATKNGKYYHLSKSCAGAGAASNTLAAALAYGFSPCPYCVTGTARTNTVAASSGTYKTGTSGVNVYASASGAYYHSNRSHAGSGAISVPLEVALNYGKKACPSCCAIASATVYASSGSKYFHIYKNHAGSGAVGGSVAKALALGLKPCSTCVTIATTNSSPNYSKAVRPTVPPTIPKSAPASTIVYINLYSGTYYYHAASKCSATGFSGGEGVTLEYVKDFGYLPCPYCHPATSISTD